MHLSLARREDHQGSSSGYWLIRQLPGFLLSRSYDGEWRIACGSTERLRGERSAKAAWGLLWEPDLSLYAELKSPSRGYRTRAEALVALEAELAEQPETLGELLTA